MIQIATIIYMLSMLFCSISHASTVPYDAFVSVHVADLVGSPLQTSTNQTETEIVKQYKELNAENSPRIHQLIFNERVQILEERGPEVRIAIFNAFYLTHNNAQPQIQYWSLKRNFVPIDKLVQQNIDPKTVVPPTINYHAPTSIDPQANIVTLSTCWCDPYTKQSFSAGTRLMQIGLQKNGSYQVAFYDARHNKVKKTLVPSHVIISEDKLVSTHDRMTTFNNLITQWARQEKSFRYVLGGCSIIPSTTSNQSVLTGIDCSSLVMRAAQICGIPYFYKNTLTLLRRLQPLTHDDSIHEGDLIYIPGHVMIVSNVEKGLLTEARCQGHGYGYVHEIHLSHVFNGINNYQDLLDAHHQHTRIYRRNAQGSIIGSAFDVTLLKLSSVWDKKTVTQSK